MMNLVVILTIESSILMSKELRIYKAKNLFADNLCLNFSGHSDPYEIGCISAYKKDTKEEKRKNLLWECIGALIDILQMNYDLSIYVCCAQSYEDNKLSRYKGIWKHSLFSKKDVFCSRGKEYFLSEDGRLFTFALAEICTDKINTLSEIIKPSSASFIVLLPQGRANIDLKTITSTGWRFGLGRFNELVSVSKYISSIDGILLRTFGEFDDTEIGADAIFRPNKYPMFFSEIPDRK